MAVDKFFKYWPENSYWSYQFSRLVGTERFGGADFAECHLAAQKMRPGDLEDWVEGWLELGRSLRERGERAAQEGRRLTARDCYQRATNYFRAAEFALQLLPDDDPRKSVAYSLCRDSFLHVLPHLAHRAEEVHIPYEGTFLSGYYCEPSTPAKPPFPTILFFGGSDSVAEELYFQGARAAVDRGYAVLIVDGPGQGASLRLRGLLARYDYEVPVAAAVDYAVSLGDVDSERIALMALSLGGYYAPRAAAFEKRLSACIAWGALYDTGAVVRSYPLPDVILPHFARLFGTTTDEATMAQVEKLTLKGILQQIECPTLVVHGECDALVPVAQAYQTYDDLRCDRALRVFKADEPGALHCQVDSPTAAYEAMYDWLDAKMIVSPRMSGLTQPN